MTVAEILFIGGVGAVVIGAIVVAFLTWGRDRPNVFLCSWCEGPVRAGEHHRCADTLLTPQAIRQQHGYITDLVDRWVEAPPPPSAEEKQAMALDLVKRRARLAQFDA